MRDLLGQGVDAIKLMTASVTASEPYPVLPIGVVRAAVFEAHQAGKPAFAHPTNRAGLYAEIEGGVDVIAHTTPETGGWDSTDVAAMIKAGVALIPTLELWDWELARAGRDSGQRARFQAAGIEELRAFAEAGGRVLFGTDVGYMTNYEPSDEYAAMARAGLSFDAILASLTTAPAAEFGNRETLGQVAVGFPADLVVLRRDPHRDPRAFSDVLWSMRGGRILYVAATAEPPVPDVTR